MQEQYRERRAFALVERSRRTYASARAHLILQRHSKVIPRDHFLFGHRLVAQNGRQCGSGADYDIGWVRAALGDAAVKRGNVRILVLLLFGSQFGWSASSAKRI